MRNYVKISVMSWFRKKNKIGGIVGITVPMNTNYSALAALTLNSITDGVLLIDRLGMIKFANPAAATMTGYNSAEQMIDLIYDAVLNLENGEGMPLANDENPLVNAFQDNRAFKTRDLLLVTAKSESRIAIELTLIPTGTVNDNRIVTFRDITTELKDEQEKSEFVSTASHEMRTPVASIEGYLALALNPQTATIDARARQYLDAAHKASKHLGDLFRDLLDVTKLDDERQRLHPVPVDIVATVREFADERAKDMQEKHLKYSFGSNASVTSAKQLNQLVYAAVDLGFLHEIVDNLIDNAIKYTPEGGEIWVNARGDGDKVVINVTDTGIGISPDDAAHIFQKFYRVDNSQTRQIGGTGLGLYLVKQRAEAMHGRVWVESAFGDGSTFFVSLPRLSDAEYQRMKIAYDNEQAVKAFQEQNASPIAQAVASAQQALAQKAQVQAQAQTVQGAGVPGAMQGVGVQPPVVQGQMMQAQALGVAGVGATNGAGAMGNGVNAVNNGAVNPANVVNNNGAVPPRS